MNTSPGDAPHPVVLTDINLTAAIADHVAAELVDARVTVPRDGTPIRLGPSRPATPGIISAPPRPKSPVAPVPSGEQLAPARPAPDRKRRSLGGYLLMPRPGDAVKALLMPLTFTLAALAHGGVDGRTVLRAALVLLVLEFLVYPARYQWNDARGFVADQQHPGGDRGRLPGPLSQARSRIAASGAVAALRLAVAGAIGLLPGLDLGPMVLVVIVGVFAVAGAYEALRAVATGRHSGATPPVRPALVLLWITVGAGYAVRGMIGLALVFDLPDRPALSLAAVVTLWAYGIAFVTSRWAIESTSFARLDGARVNWAADASHAREHLLALTRWLPSAPDADTADGSLERWAAVRGRTPMSAPWNLALAIAGAAAAVTGVLLTGSGTGSAPWLLAAAGGAGSLAVAGLPRWRPLAAVAVAAGLLVALTATAAPRPFVAVLPWIAMMAAYLHFVGQSRATMGQLGRTVRAALRRLLTPVARAAVGDRTWQALNSSGLAGE